MRIDAYLSKWGVGTRKQIAEAIQRGAVYIDGERCKKKNAAIQPNQTVAWYGETLEYRTTFSYVMHKRKGVVTGREENVPSVYADLPLLAQKQSVQAVGRLDKDTTGLLFFTDDGDLLHRLTAPKYNIPRRYVCTYEGTLPVDAEEQLAQGFAFKEGHTAPVQMERLDNQQVALTLTEGRYHEVKRLMSALGCRVVDLHRTHYAGFALPESLQPGEAELLPPDFLAQLFERTSHHERL